MQFQCHNCGRKFNPKSYEIHSRSCTHEKPHKSAPGWDRSQIPQNSNSSSTIDEFSSQPTQKRKKRKKKISKTPQPKKRNYGVNPSTSNRSFSEYSTPTRRPVALVCYLCGAQYGITSLRIHLKSCEKKYINLLKKLPKRFHKHPLPSPPPSELFPQNRRQLKKIEKFNLIAFDIFQTETRVQCSGCNLKLSVDVLLEHVKKCKRFVEDSLKKKRISMGPKMYTCDICKQQFGSTSLPIHRKTCMKKYLREKAKVEKDIQNMMKSGGKGGPSFSVFSPGGVSIQSNSNNMFVRRPNTSAGVVRRGNQKFGGGGGKLVPNFTVIYPDEQPPQEVQQYNVSQTIPIKNRKKKKISPQHKTKKKLSYTSTSPKIGRRKKKSTSDPNVIVINASSFRKRKTKRKKSKKKVITYKQIEIMDQIDDNDDDDDEMDSYIENPEKLFPPNDFLAKIPISSNSESDDNQEGDEVEDGYHEHNELNLDELLANEQTEKIEHLEADDGDSEVYEDMYTQIPIGKKYNNVNKRSNKRLSNRVFTL